MKKLLVAGIATCAGVLISSAAVAQTPDPLRYAGEFSGFYAGVNGGGMQFKSSGNFAAPGDVWGDAKKDATLAGLHGGFQGQWGNFVLGVEGGWQANLSDGFSSAPGTSPPACASNIVFACQTRLNDMVYVGPRIGVAMGQWLLYATGGYARGEVETRVMTVATGVAIEPTSRHHDGWYWGGGLDFLAMHGFVVGAEYRHYDFSNAFHSFAPGSGDNRNVKVNADAVLLRLTIKQ